MRLVFLLFIISIISCSTDTAQYEYADGNGNFYIIKSRSLVYFPVKPEESSSGTYNGGEAKSVSLTPEQFKSIREVLEKGIKSNNHIQERVKMSGAISVVGEKDKTHYILTPGSPEIINIETLLKEIIRN